IQDDGFHEIQLNGKQLVFLFMAATVVSVVIFLCGVLVGRGVRAERSLVDTASITTSAETMPQQPPSTPVPAASGSDPRTAAAPSVYRVRVGKFPTRREAESIAARLQREEQFKPWVTR